MKHLNRLCFSWLPAAAVVLPLAIAGVAQAGGGVLSNFETGTLEGWIAEAGGVTLTPDNTTSSEGSWSVRIDATPGGFFFGAMRYDQGAVNPHQPLYVEGTRWRADVLAGTFTDFLSVRNSYIPSYGNGTDNGGTVNGPDINVQDFAGQWTTVEWAYPQPPSASAPAQGNPPPFWIEWISINSNGPITMWIDNIRTVPEPASLALWCLGGVGLAALRRNRR